MSNFSFVTVIWKRSPSLLSRSLSTWANQSHPPIEIIVSDINPNQDESDRIKDVCDEYDIVTHIHTPFPTFSLGRSINIGIKASSPDADYLICTGSEMIFSENYLEEWDERITPDILTQVACGWLPKEVPMPPRPHDEWDRLVNSISKGSNKQVSGGAFLCASRDWWFKIHGYDEGIHFLWPDSDLARRAILSGMKLKGMHWGVAQALHQWHEPFGYIAPGRSLESLQADTTITRNLNGWGER